jgi:CDP-glucose 4,6-dehydratase
VDGLEMTQFADIYRDRRILLTGHTGFKGSWLALWLHELGAYVTGLALSPNTDPNHWDLLNLNILEYHVDVRDYQAVQKIFEETKPEIIFHLAAQPLVRRSYRDPLETWSTNVMGTANILEACRHTDTVSAIVVITTDKVYDNQEWCWGYREDDRLGGHDPYSASKAASELIADSYRKAFFQHPDAPLVATARAGNTIGGGDWSEDRLIPDLIRSVSQSQSLEIRSPNATRPWQHVLECLSGYLLLGQKLLEREYNCAESWNLGPCSSDNRRVVDILEMMKFHWPELQWYQGRQESAHEANFLYLDNAKSRLKLGWEPVWGLEECLRATANWYREYLTTGAVISSAQLNEYIRTACLKGCSWVEE